MNWAVERPIGRLGRSNEFKARSIGTETYLARDRSAERGDRSALALLDARVLGRSFGWNAPIDRLSLGPPVLKLY